MESSKEKQEISGTVDISLEVLKFSHHPWVKGEDQPQVETHDNELEDSGLSAEELGQGDSLSGVAE